MYKLTDIKDIHLEITSKCQAKCPMCPRRVNGGILNPFLQLSEIDLETFKIWFSIDFIKQLDSLYMCGNYGDPIIAKDCLEIFQYLKEHNPNIFLSMHTNGSARDTIWWGQLAKIVNRVVFGIDGLGDTHHLYRINTDFNKIITNANAFIEAGGIAEWHMLVFEHNEHQVENCRQLSKLLGFAEFKTKHTSRFINNKFHVLDDSGKTINILRPTTYSLNLIPKVQHYLYEEKPHINCKAVQQKNIYVSATGLVSPCCWLDFEYILPKQESRIEYMDRIGIIPNLHNQSLEEIFNSNYFNNVEKTWDNDPLLECSKQCGNFDKFNSQFVDSKL